MIGIITCEVKPEIVTNDTEYNVRDIGQKIQYCFPGCHSMPAKHNCDRVIFVGLLGMLLCLITGTEVKHTKTSSPTAVVPQLKLRVSICALAVQ